MIKLNDDKELVEMIDNQLNENLKKYGQMYCPCAVIHNESTICMCEDFRNLKEGQCHCGKFIKYRA